MRIVPEDPVLGTLPDLFPARGAPDFVGEAVRDAVGVDVDPACGELTFVRYQPTKHCVLLWSFSTPSGQRLLVSGKLYRNGAGERAAGIRKVRGPAERLGSPDGGSNGAHRYLPERRFLLTIFPTDFRLPSLPLATSEPWIRQNILPPLGLGQAGVRRVRVTPLSYRPWRRCVFRYDVEGQTGTVRYFAKVFRDDRGQAIHANLETIRAQLRDSNSPWEITEPVTYVPGAQMLVLRGVDGGAKARRLMRTALKERSASEELAVQMARAADGLGPFQRTAVDGLARVTPRDLIRQLRPDIETLCIVAPSLARRIEQRLRELDAALDRLRPEPLVPTHGAFRAGQLLLCRDKLVVLDLDTLCLSGASADAGNFLAYLDQFAVRRPRLRAVTAACEKAFVEALSRSSSASSGWLSWYRAESHLKVAIRAFHSLSPGWPQMTEAILDLAGQTLGREGSS